ncbi:hypothetical protein [Methylocystis parvus]|uniref:Uncharacterized protein n=1 Tax=Methylocystis parvus TaxID=134 RepID=A0A6B8MA57_9HYPH|nr:hypothetical protein [Methylocystis parvus]QGM98173.1 hypothetical protein F7D14_12280 [Methylocystis parvus]WBK01502.1 hypothetical protein MMG94_07295 [Methylocystis parvus OBBP]
MSASHKEADALDFLTRRILFWSGGPRAARTFYGGIMRRIAFSLLAAAAAYFVSIFPSKAKDAVKDQIVEVKPRAVAVAAAPKEVSLDRDGASLLTIPATGRYSVRAKTPTGARIELVDMIAGPLDSSGAPGLRDGRIDALLDKGVYKLRIGAVKDAKGKASVSVDPFTEIEAARPTLAPGVAASGELGDLQQRSYALEATNDNPVFIEAVGRALQDLRVWAADGALADLSFERTTIETRPGRAMNRLRLEGKLPAGRYVVTAYGGEKLVWSDGASAQPFMLRLAEPALLAAGVAEGVIGPFGAARYEAPASYDSFRLELPQQAPARLDVKRGTARDVASIGKSSRAPVASLRLSGDGAATARVEVMGFEGQSYTLRALRQSTRETFEASGPHLVSVDVAGEGGDEAPLTALFARVEKDGKTQVLASDLPRVGAGKAWRGKFNLLGPASLLFEATRDGPVAIDSKGVKLRVTVEPALGNLAPRADGKDATRFDLVAGYYLVTLEPLNGAGGVVDVTIGPPGLAAPAPAQAPSRASLSFGQRTLETNGSYLILTNAASQLLTGPRVVALPADLAKAPLALHQSPGQELTIPLRVPKDGKIVARDATGADVALVFVEEKTENDQRLVTVKIAAPEKERALGLIRLPETLVATPETADGKDNGKTRATAGRPAFFDLKRDETRSLPFDVAQGGLYRIETLGRMKTALRVGAAVSPRLGEGEANGPGNNALVTTYLRAGTYRAGVTAKDSEGHLGLAVSPATLTQTAKIADKGDARATLAPGKGAVVPVEITRAGDYRIELASLAGDWQARLEDAEGWPLTKPGAFKRETHRFEPGAYRLVVSPADAEARMVARIRPIVAKPPLEGHGPHPLPFEKAQKLQWREPQAKDSPRAPDIWRFTLAGDSDVELTIGEGMIGDIVKGAGEAIGKVVGDRPFKGKLAAGDYRVEARSLSHDDRLDYEIALASPQLQPGAPKRIDPPATLEFNLARESVVDLSTFGDRETIGALKTTSGEVVERLEPRANDWNVALSRRLPAGAYRLELEELGATRNPPTAQEEENASAEQETNEETASEDGAASDKAAADADEDESGVETRLALLAEKDGAPLALDGETTVAGADAQRFALPAAPAGSLAMVTARSVAEVAISIERREGDRWRVVGAERGLAPVAAWPADEKSEWRATVWSVDGGGEPVTIGARALEQRARRPGDVSFDAVDAKSQLCVAKVETPDAALVELTSADAILAGSAPGRLLRPARTGALAPQAQALWLLTRDCKAKAHVAAFEWLGQEVALDIGEGERAFLPPLGAPRGKTRLWLARSTFAQPAIDAGKGMGVAQGAALALASDAAPQLWNADGSAAMRATLSAIDVETRPAVGGGALYAGLVLPMSALPIDLEKSGAPLALDLAGGLAAFTDKQGVFGDGAAVSRVLNGASDRVLLVNMTETPLPARIARTTDAPLALTTKTALKRFFGVAGQIALPIDAQKDDRLIVFGADATVVSQSGRIQRGRDLTLDGPGDVTLDYKPGLVAAWIERGGAAPWPQSAARAATAPQRVALEGAAMRFAVKRDAPVMLTASSGAPALVSFTQNGKRETFAYPAGVEFRHYMAAGDATLDIYAPHDGALSGALDIAAQKVIEAHEGVNDAIAVAPGASALFSFETKRNGDIGVGVRAEPDRVSARLLDASGKTLGEGLGQVMKLAPGRYFLEARVPADATATTIRAAIVGVSPPPASPPEEVVADLLDKAGMKKSK